MKKANGETVKRVFSFLKPYRLLIILSFLFAAGSAVLLLYIPVLAGRMIDYAVDVGNVDLSAIARLAVIAALVAVVASLLQWFTNVINNKIVYCVIRDMRKAAFEKISALPLSYLDVHETGDLLSRVIADVDVFADGLLLGFSQLFQGIVTIAVTLVFMLTINWIITIVVVVITPLSIFTAKFIASRTYSKFKEQSEAKGELTALVNECFVNQKLVKAYSQGASLVKRFDDVNEKLEKTAGAATFYSSLTNPTTRFINSLVYAAVAVSGALLCINNPVALTVGSLSSLLAYSNRYTKPFNEISDTVTEMQNAFACAERVFALLDEKEDVDPENAKDVVAEGNIEIKELYFSYVKDKPLLQNVNVSAPKGKHIAIVGPTGCGKTTLINLLMKFYRQDQGSIIIDGENYDRLKARGLRSNYGMVLQDTWLKVGATVKENVAFGKPDATDEEVTDALIRSGAYSFVSRLSDGINTVIGDGEISQGQKQLLCISRVMLRMPPVLILDEATSSIDTNTEMKIQRSFAELTKGKTSFTVAHRLSTIEDADLILVMKDGNVIEQGNHEELLKLNGFYAHLLRSMGF